MHTFTKSALSVLQKERKNTVTTRINSLDHDLSSDMCSQDLNQGFISEILNERT